MKESVKERKLRETTNYLITIANRAMGNFPFGIAQEVYFISEDVRSALKNIGTKQSRFFVKEIENADLRNKLPGGLCAAQLYMESANYIHNVKKLKWYQFRKKLQIVSSFEDKIIKIMNKGK